MVPVSIYSLHEVLPTTSIFIYFRHLAADISSISYISYQYLKYLAADLDSIPQSLGQNSEQCNSSFNASSYRCKVKHTDACQASALS